VFWFLFTGFWGAQVRVDPATFLRAANRSRLDPDDFSDNNGFRCARDVDA
jgi:formylglycine-generating enzyme required for sulfatase activity